MSATFNIGGHFVSLAILLVATAVLQWLVFASMSAFSRARLPKAGIRRADRNLVISSAVFAVLWISAFATFGGSKPAVAAAATTERTQGSCTSVDVGMSSAAVKSRLGEPDEMRNDEETRGPSASKWIYRGSRCVVHVFEDKVEFID